MWYEIHLRDTPTACCHLSTVQHLSVNICLSIYRSTQGDRNLFILENRKNTAAIIYPAKNQFLREKARVAVFIQLHTADKKPVAACYICYAQLNKSYKLMLTSTKAESILTKIFQEDTKITNKTLAVIDHQAVSMNTSLSVHQSEPTDIHPHIDVQIKLEPMEEDSDHQDTPDYNPDGTNDYQQYGHTSGTEQYPVNIKVEVDVPDLGDDSDDNRLSIENENHMEESSTSWKPDSPKETKAETEDGEHFLSLAHAEKPYACNVCPRRFVNISRLNYHLKTHADGKSEEGGVSHDENESAPKLYECRLCQRRFSFKENLTAHLQEHTAEKPFECDICHRRFSYRQSLRLHVAKHSNAKPFECTVCYSRFSDKRSLKGHLVTHDIGKETHECHLCDRKFNHKCSLQYHVKTHSDERPYQCPACPQGFREKHYLTVHLRIHSGEMPYACDVCDRKFNNTGSLVRHKRTHTGEKPHECNICQRRFSQASNLQNHFIKHFGDKPHECDVCHSKFSTKAYLQKHFVTHSGDKQYQCTICQRRFAQQSHLTRHTRTHTGERPYECEHCKRKFIQSTDLKTHLRTHTGEKPFECSVCKRRFSVNRLLVKHAKSHENAAEKLVDDKDNVEESNAS